MAKEAKGSGEEAGEGIRWELDARDEARCHAIETMDANHGVVACYGSMAWLHAAIVPWHGCMQLSFHGMVHGRLQQAVVTCQLLLV
jgi:hypothetical protein